MARGERGQFVPEWARGSTGPVVVPTKSDDMRLSITAVPQRLGQIAIVAGQAYIATGVATTADWKRIT